MAKKFIVRVKKTLPTQSNTGDRTLRLSEEQAMEREIIKQVEVQA
jgi:hypothetical protein